VSYRVETGPGWELRCGRWQEVLADVERVDATIVDAPYSERTHSGNQDMRGRFGSAERRSLEYACWTPEDVAAFVKRWSKITSGWIAAMTDDDLAPVYKARYADHSRYAFAQVPIVAPRVRLTGDGPASSTIYLMVSRPKRREFLSWGALPGWYYAKIDRDGHIGGKPPALMRAIVRDYSRPGDLICDPCAGYGTTLLAAVAEGRSAIGAEVDPETFEKAVARLRRGITPDLFASAQQRQQRKPEPKQASLLGDEEKK
jgi:hypothetical protein